MKYLGHISRNRLIQLVLIILIVNATFGYISSHSAYQFGADGGLPSTNINQIIFPFSIWFYSNYSGYLNTTALSNPLAVFYQIIMFILSGLNFGSLLNNILNIIIPKILGGTGMLLLVYFVLNTEKKFNINAAIAGVFASILFTIHYGLFSGFGTGIISVSLMPFSILFLFLFARSSYSKIFQFRYFLLSVLSISLELGFLNYTYIIQGFIVIFLISIFLVVFAKRELRSRLAMYIACILILSIAINLSWILVLHEATSLSTAEIQMLSSNSQSDFVNFYAPLVVGYDNDILPTTGVFAVPNIIFSIILTIVSLILLVYLQKKDKLQDAIRSAFVIGMVATLLIMLTAMASIHKPFGSIFLTLYKVIPYLIIFRYASNSHFIVLFLMSALSGFAFGKLLEDYHKNNRQVMYAIVFVVMAILLSYYIYVGSILTLSIPGIPYDTGSQYATLLPFVHRIPPYVLNISSYINNQSGYFTVATIPVDDDWHIATWYDAPDVYVGLINDPVYTGGFAASEFFFPPSQDEYKFIGEMIQQAETKNLSISNGLGIFGIKYIIVQGDTSNHTLSPNNPLLPYSFNAIYANLNNSNGIVFKKYYNTTSLYQDSKAVPLIYPTNIYLVNTSNSQGIINKVMNKSFNISAYSVYSKNFSAPILWYGNTQIFESNDTAIMPVPNLVKPNVTFIVNTQTKITIHVSNATTPYYLVFRETYDPHWAAFYSNGTEVNPRNHIAVNGFANAWYMNKTGNYTVTLYYTPQTEVWIAWGISFAALFVTIGIGVYGWKEAKKEKIRSRR